jgi:trans-2,3-dihydro-3-hydroxyanthranilate isomerase
MTMQGRRYVVYDVFTDTALAGNPLAVVLDAEGLDLSRMQAIAREFNLSESSFVLAPEDPLHKARLRIFTPDHEMPFAGHPTVGTAIALADLSGVDAAIFVLEENIGPVRCAVTRSGGIGFGEFDLAILPAALDLAADKVAIGAALGLGPHEIGFENHGVGMWSAGVPYVTVPVANLEAAAKAMLHTALWSDLAGRDANGNLICAYVYCRETIGFDNHFHARMFVPGDTPWEDPATGSAAAAFAGAMVHFDQPVDGLSQVWIEQGVEMGRPSRIRLEVEVKAGRIKAARIGGQARKVAEGVLFA